MEMAELVVVGQDCGLISSFGGGWEAPGHWQLHSWQRDLAGKGQADCRGEPPAGLPEPPLGISCLQ